MKLKQTIAVGLCVVSPILLSASPASAAVKCPVPRNRGAEPANIKQLIDGVAAEFHVDAGVMNRIAGRETTWNPTRVNRSSKASGLFQHMPKFWGARVSSMNAATGNTDTNIMNPKTNARVAAFLIKTEGTRHWGC